MSAEAAVTGALLVAKSDVTIMDPGVDERLIERMIAYQAGELDAFEDVFSLLAVNVRNYLASLTRSVDRADDLLQDTFF